MQKKQFSHDVARIYFVIICLFLALADPYLIKSMVKYSLKMVAIAGMRRTISFNSFVVDGFAFKPKLTFIFGYPIIMLCTIKYSI